MNSAQLNPSISTNYPVQPYVHKHLPLQIHPNYIEEEKKEVKLAQYEVLLLDHADVIIHHITQQIIEKLQASKELLEQLKIELKKDKQFSEHLSKLSQHIIKEQCPADFNSWKEQDAVLKDFEWCTPDSDIFLKSLQELGSLANLTAERKNQSLSLQTGYIAGLDGIALQEKAKRDAKLWTQLRKKINLSTLSFMIKALKWVIELTISRQLFVNRATVKILMMLFKGLKF